ncbi:hypothetical protein [Aeromonas veronii]|uniref:Uncharacterized protein n=1 Tax=Aeromonas veronii TaxID=654 RepID=A0A4S5CH77_AERVE|nr:hypothetical protein [Aeromonas veronii]THJ45030.1 hypothetical protein E8Q35_12655 [Aeromonas veronii]
MTRIVKVSDRTITIRDQKVPTWFVDELGRRYEFDSMAVLDQNGRFEMSNLNKRQCILSPGAIYNLASPQ